MRAWFGNSAVRRIIFGVTAAVLGFVALGAWAISSPVGSSPDDDYHLVSIWCGLGDREGICETPENAEPGGDTRMVPRSLFIDAVCYSYKPAVGAACMGDLDGAGLTETARGNFVGDYPPVFYGVMSLFVGEHIEASVLVMRFFNAALFVAFLSVLTWLTPAARRAAVVLPVVATAVPLGMFIIASVNPSSWALLSASTLWISLYNFFETTGRRRWLFAGLAALALVLGAGARADAAAYAGLAIVGVLILEARRTKAFWLSAIVPAVFIVVAIVFYRSSGQSSAASGGLGTVPGGQFARELFQAFIAVPDLWAGMLGRWGLGWLDTAMPALVWVSSLAIFAAVVFAGLARSGVRKYLAAGLMFAALWGVPTLLQAQSHAPVGNYIQPRYILPIAILVVAFALVATRERIDFSPAQIVVIVLALTAANSLALHTNIRRYVTGLDNSGVNLSYGVEWWWGEGVTPMVAWLIGSLAFGLCLALLGYLARSSVGQKLDRRAVPA
ncbi:DUF2142 domain-containing protein [Agromyces protaetiae]|uniref:DUF2142 domain-containing protein n=1 Tax=Agromyces protaetiae TaxID=2509455 RepID=A0A4V0YHG0_9MICO|nr:DUF2142 domain-containing protein [Agromyces protaetiae]QAY74581.1 DUF2142 domain-containing protein [Agromyces protaetiae]